MKGHSPAREERRGPSPGLRAGVCAAFGVMVLLGAPPSTSQGNPFQGKRLYVDPNSHARRQADAWARSRPRDAALMRLIAEQPQAMWMGDWLRDVRAEVDARVTTITRAGALPVFVVYNVPHRDCGLYSAGGARGGDDYRRWILGFARGLRNRAAVVILEPDGLPSLDCLPARFQDERYVLLREAVQVLKGAGAAVYVDAGNANWKQPAVMAERLRRAGIELADGFSLNVSNFHGVQPNITYGERLSRLVGGKHFVIDTSRNGRGAAVERQWCNAPNQALGRAPTTRTGHPLVDAFLWVKTPGQSDGTCNGGPRAGEWWADYALELSRAAQALGSLAPR
jgi:endoglucanase